MNRDELWGELNALRQRAEAGPIGKRKSSFELYRLLADCMGFAIRCMKNTDQAIALRLWLEPPPRDNPRSRKGIVYSDTSEFQLVCRYVFKHGVSDRAKASNASRYGKALEEAYRRKIGPAQLERFLTNEGGVAALFLARPLAARSIKTKTLYLSKSIEVPKGETFTLTLRRKPNGVFEVIE